MGLGKLLRGAADYADKATSAVAQAADTAMAAAKEKAADLRGEADNEAAVYESALEAVGDAIADAGQMNSSIATIITDLAEGNPYK